MREISVKKVSKALRNLCAEVNYNLSEDVYNSLNEALARETSENAREILRQLIQNASYAKKEKMPICQDTGLAVVFVELGQDVKLTGGSLKEAINKGVSLGYKLGYLRKSVTKDPLGRGNTDDNTPAVIHIDLVPGDGLKIGLLAKGGGAENCSAIKMFKPTSTKKEIEDFVIETVKKAGPNPCPPTIVGVGIGGNFDHAAYLAKKALTRTVGMHSSAKSTAKWEQELLKKINSLGIGPMGLGGKTTALAVNIEKRPCHISSLPVAVNLDCHAHRFKEVKL